MKVLALLVALMFGALSTRLWYLQVLATGKYGKEVTNNSVRYVSVAALRGRILDDTGHRVFVQNRMSLEVQVKQQELGPDPEAELLHLSEVIKVPVARIVKALQDKRYYPYQPIPVAIDVDPSVDFYISEHQSEFTGVKVVEASVRDYPQDSLAAQVLGSTGLIDANQLKDPAFKAYGQSDVVGKSGLELTYERFLRGTTGLAKFLVDAQGQIVRPLGSQPAVAGDDVVLSIDEKIQRYAEDSLAEGIAKARTIVDSTNTQKLFRANAGAVVILDAHDGSVRAMASYPTFDPSWFVQGLTNQQNVYVNNDFLSPLFNRTEQASYAPGSTFKPFVALSAVHDGIASLGSTYACPGDYTYPGDTSGTIFHNWTPTSSVLSIAEALKVSCDTVFYGFGGKYYTQWAQNPLGKSSEPFQRSLRAFGFGRDTGVDLPSETAGLIPTAAWKQQYAAAHPELYRPDERSWLPGDDILMAIGQGSVLVSPLQLATAYAAIANGGHLCVPRIADHIQTADGKLVRKIPKDCHRTLPYTKTQLDYIRNALATVTQLGGTAAAAFAGFPLSQIPVAGKTGTAERPGFDAGQDTSWFAAMVPANDPQYVIVAMVEQGGHGSTTAAPIVRQIIEKIYGITSSGFVPGGAND